MRWAGFGPEHDTWEPLANLGGAMQHVEAYEEQQKGIACAHCISELLATCGSIAYQSGGLSQALRDRRLGRLL
eukprot:COSAG02_NODE_1731_length_11173_cov_6.039281_10_plen_73_part_00